MKFTQADLDLMLSRRRTTAVVKPKRSKYGNVREKIDGINFHSKAEAHYYVQLKQLQASGLISFFLMQVPIQLPGGVKYVIDFVEWWNDGKIKWVDVKGVKTDVYKIKKKQVEALYPILITEV